MRCGCISLGNIKCDGCKRIIPYPNHYLSFDDTDGVHKTLCVGCSLAQGLAQQSDKDDAKVSFILE